MNHSYQKSLTSDSCAKCKRSEKDHSKEAQCEACSNIGPCDLLGEMLLCNSCTKKEFEIAIAQMRESSANFDQARINLAVTNPIGAILKSVEVDKALEVREDFFNAETTSIVELQAALGTTEDANYELAKMIQVRYNHFKSVLIEMKSAEQNLLSRQRAIAQYLNDLAGKISAEKRAELKIGDINYPAKVDKPKAPPKPRLTVEEKMATNLFNSRLNKAAQQLIDEKVAKNLEEGLQIAKHRGLGITMDKARELIRQTLMKA